MRARKCICALALGAAALGVSVYAAPRDGAAARDNEQVRSDSLRLTTGSDAVLRDAVGGIADQSQMYMRLAPVNAFPGGSYPTGTVVDSDNNTMISPGGPHLIWLDVRFGNWGGGEPGAVKTFQWTVGPTANLPPGISRPTPACADHADCDAIGFGPGKSPSFDSGCIGNVCRAWFVQDNTHGRTDYMGEGWGPVFVCTADYSCAHSESVSPPGQQGRVDDGNEYYLGTAIVSLDVNDFGTIVVPINPDPWGTWVIRRNDHTDGIAKIEDAVIEIIPPGVDTCGGGSNDGGRCSTNADCPGGMCGLKNRYIAIRPSTGVARGGSPLSIHVCIDSMPQYPDREGECWWAGPSISMPGEPPLTGAQLLCETSPSHAEEWPSGYLHVFGAAVIPNAEYEVRMCDENGSNCSDPLVVATGPWGDVAAPFGGGLQPNFGDINTIGIWFRGLDILNRLRGDLVGISPPGTPNTPNGVVNFADISAGLDAFRGQQYPYTVPACP